MRRHPKNHIVKLQGKPWFTVVASGLLLASALVAGPAAGADDMPTFHLLAKAGRFQPETVEVPANVKFRLMVKNEGPEAEEFEMTNPFKEKVLAPGAERAIIFQPLKPGTYPFFGEFHLQTAQGRIVAK